MAWGMERSTIDIEEGWDYVQRGITKLINILEGLPEQKFNYYDYMMLYTMIYNMSTQKPPFDYEWELYERYRETFEEYITSTILPSLREKHEEIMLSEFVRRWSNHCIMVRWLSRFFSSLDRRFIATKSLPSLKEVGNTCFTSLVYQEFHTKVRNVVMSLIAKERDGEQIDLDLLKNVVNVFIDIGNGAMDYYEKDLEEALLKDTAAYYSRKASNWILEADYMSKVEECLERESERASHYLHSSSVPKLLEIVRHELLSVSATQMLQTVAL